MPAVAEPPSLSSSTRTVEEADRDISILVERFNIAENGRFRAEFMTPGVINYTDLDDGGQELLRKRVIDEALETLKGAPLTIGHIPSTTTDFTDVENGRVDKVGFNAETGWHYCEGTVSTEVARNHIRDGWRISVGTRVLKFGPGASWLGNPYDREIKRLRFHHLALVPPGQKPRFEEAAIRLNSVEEGKSSDGQGNATRSNSIMFKLFKRKASAQPGGQPTEEASDLAPDTKLTLPHGTATAKELIDLGVAERANAGACHMVDSGDYIEHEGVRYNVGHLVDLHKTHCAASHHLEARPNAVETPEQKAAKDVESAATAVGEAKTKLDAAKTVAERANSTDAEKADYETAKTKHSEAMIAAGEAADRFNALVRAGKTEPKAAGQTETERKLAEAETKLAEATRTIETERENARRAAGARSFAVLAGASRAPAQAPYTPPSGGLRTKIALGKRLCGSDPRPAVGAGKN